MTHHEMTIKIGKKSMNFYGWMDIWAVKNGTFICTEPRNIESLQHIHPFYPLPAYDNEHMY